jgi:hypothetical protein
MFNKEMTLTRETLTCTVLPSGDLLLAASNDCRAFIREKQSELDDVSILSELTECYWTNSGFHPFDAGAGNPFVGLTSAPCIAEDMDYPDNGQRQVIGRLWYFPNYMLESPCDTLKRRGRVVFTLAKE